MVYSTCSVLVEENEQVVQYALEKRKNVRIVPTGIDFGREAFRRFRGRVFDDKMPLAKRIFVSKDLLRANDANENKASCS